jgi:hypothetical protein
MNKKGLVFVFLILYCLNEVYCEKVVGTGNDMAFSKDEYIRMLSPFFDNNWERLNNIYSESTNLFRNMNYIGYEITEICEINIYEKNFLIVAIHSFVNLYDDSYIYYEYKIFEINRQSLIIDYLDDFWIANLRKKDISYDVFLRTLMNKVPGVHIGNAPIAIVDIDGDGVVEILGFIIYGYREHSSGQLYIHKYFTEMNMFYLQLSHSFAIINNIPLIDFIERNNRIEIDYTQSADH